MFIQWSVQHLIWADFLNLYIFFIYLPFSVFQCSTSLRLLGSLVCVSRKTLHSVDFCTLKCFAVLQWATSSDFLQKAIVVFTLMACFCTKHHSPQSVQPAGVKKDRGRCKLSFYIFLAKFVLKRWLVFNAVLCFTFSPYRIGLCEFALFYIIHN